MANIDVIFNVEGSEAVESANQALEGTGGAADSAGSGFAGLTTPLNQGIELFQKAGEAILSTLRTLRAWGEEFDRQASIINRFNGNISNASQRLNGMISDIDLMTSQTKLMRAGLALSAEDFATVAVAAHEMGSEIGEGGIASLEKFQAALIAGSAEGLAKFVGSLEGVTGKANIQAEALRRLRGEYENVSSNADTFGGRIAQLEILMDNFTTEVIKAVNENGALTDSVTDLIEAFQELVGIYGELSTLWGGSGSILQDFKQQIVAISIVIGTLVDQFRHLIDGTNAWLNSDFEGAVRSFSQVGNVGGDFVRRASRQVTNESSEGDSSGESVDSDAAKIARERIAAALARKNADEDAPTRRGGGGGESEEQRLRAEQEMTIAIARETVAEMLSVEDMLTQGLAEQDQQRIDAEFEYQRIRRELNQEAAESYSEAWREAFAAKQEAEENQVRISARLSAENHKNAVAMADGLIGVAEQGAAVGLSIFGENVVVEETINAVVSAAKAASSFASYDYYGGAAHILAGVMHGAAAVKAATETGAGGAGSAPTAPKPPPRPSESGPQGPGAGGSVNVAVYGSVFSTGPLAGRALAENIQRSEQRL